MNARSSALRWILAWPRPEWVSDSAPAWPNWSRSVYLMAGGDYVGAFELLNGVITSRSPEIAGLAEATLASGYRQLGRHDLAVVHDERASQAPGIAQLDGLTGLAADQIGISRLDQCGVFLDQARAALSRESAALNGNQCARANMRILWVQAECGLASGRPALAPAAEALQLAADLASPRHQLKTRLIAGVARREEASLNSSTANPVGARRASAVEVGDEPEGDVDGDIDAELASVLREAFELEIHTLVWPAALALGPSLTEPLRVMAADSVRFINGRLPAGIGQEWTEATRSLVTAGSG